MRLPFRDRVDAGEALASLLEHYRGSTDVIVLGLPRGGVPVASAVAEHLGAPMDVFLVRKLGVPGHEELAFGAIASGGVRVFNEDVIRASNLPNRIIEAVSEREGAEIVRREHVYRPARPPVDARGKTVILVDDGLATGATMLAAVRALRTMEPRRIVVAAPVGAEETCRMFRREADEVVCAARPEPFRAVGLWYDDFTPTSDTEVIELLQRPAADMVQSNDRRRYSE